MPSPSAFSKFVLSVLKFLGILKFSKYTQNVLGILKWANLCSKISLLSIPKLFWGYFKNWVCLKNLSMLKTNFEKADGLGISSVIFMAEEETSLKSSFSCQCVKIMVKWIQINVDL